MFGKTPFRLFGLLALNDAPAVLTKEVPTHNANCDVVDVFRRPNHRHVVAYLRDKENVDHVEETDVIEAMDVSFVNPMPDIAKL